MTRGKQIVRDDHGRIQYVLEDIEFRDDPTHDPTPPTATKRDPGASTATKYVRTTAKAPTSRGTFEGLIDVNPPEGDKDHERIESFRNLPGTFPLGYQHAIDGDPGAQVGTAHVLFQGDGRHLTVLGKLDLTLPMAQAVHERLLLPATDPMALSELSVGFSFDPMRTRKDANGVRVIVDAQLLELSIVYRGAQTTAITNVKNARTPDPELAAINAKLDDLARIPKSSTPDVDEFIRAEARRRDAEAAQKRALDAAVAAVEVRELLPSEADRDAADAERRERELAAIAQRDRERLREAEVRRRVEVERRRLGRTW